MIKNDRLVALELLLKFFSDRIPLSHLLQSKKNITPFSKEICNGVCRHYYRLESLANSLLAKQPKSLEVWLVLLIGLYQLHFMQKPDYAVVKETVALLEPLKKTWAKGLINAVLRNYCREQSALLERVENTSPFQYGHPDWFIQRLQKDWPQNWEKILTANDEHPPMSLRVNRRKINRHQFMDRLNKAGIAVKAHQYSADGVRLEKACSVYEIPGFAEGEISVQDESAQLAVSLLDLKPQLRILDACCAPGGKLCHILEVEPGLSHCLALDIDDKRLKRVSENLTRLGLEAFLVQGDGLKPDTWWSGQPFDRILVDAPCSSTGVIRRHPDIKLLRSEEEINQIIQLQSALLEGLWPLLSQNGLLVYATCSVLNEENEEQIEKFISKHPDSHFLYEAKNWGRFTGHGWQILPGDFDGDGFFYSVLHKM